MNVDCKEKNTFSTNPNNCTANDDIQPKHLIKMLSAHLGNDNQCMGDIFYNYPENKTFK